MPQRNGHMMAAVLHGREDLKFERVPIPAVGPDDLLDRSQGRAHLRHGFQSMEAGLPRADDCAAGDLRS